MRDTRRPEATPLEQTAPDLEQEVDPDGLGEARLRNDVARTEADYADDAPEDGAPTTSRIPGRRRTASQ